MSDLKKIPCTIVTGFLGAGKTTLVRHLLENAGGRRLAVLVNEFGDLGFDGSFIEGCGIEGCTRTTSSNCRTAASAARWPTISCRP